VAPPNARYAASLTACVCVALTLLLNVAPQLDPTLGNRRVHVALEVAAGMVLIFIAAVLLGRFRFTGSSRTLFKFAAVVILAFDNLYSAVLTMTVASVSAGGFATWTFAADGVLGAFLLAVGALMPDRPVRHGARGVLIALGASISSLALIIGSTALLGERLPGVFADDPETGDELRLLSEHAALLVVELLTAVCFALAAAGFARHADEEDDEFLQWLSVGSVIAAVAFVNYALFPSQFTELVYSGDLFFLAAVAALLVGAVREIAREEAARIRTAVIEERRRVARDLHDGVAQELAFIASQMRVFLRQPVGAVGTEPMQQVIYAVDRALDESRGAIAALSRPIDEPLDRALGHAALDVADRAGAKLSLELASDVHVSPAWRDALLRIAREAITNAVRHGGARSINVQLDTLDGVRLRVTDNGNGFDLASPRSSQSFGLTSMRERTESLGGRFSISSMPGAGTTVEVIVR
jgi:signal transduction histidine kinase